MCIDCDEITLPIGPQGPQGPAGNDGTNGTNGTNGSNGMAWYSIPLNATKAGASETFTEVCRIIFPGTLNVATPTHFKVILYNDGGGVGEVRILDLSHSGVIVAHIEEVTSIDTLNIVDLLIDDVGLIPNDPSIFSIEIGNSASEGISNSYLKALMIGSY